MPYGGKGERPAQAGRSSLRASRGRRQPSGQRPRCPSARLPVPRVAGAIAAAHAIWREGGASRAGRTEFPPHIAGLNFPHASRMGTHRRVKFLPRVAGGGIRRRAHRAAGGNHPGSGPVDRQPACRSLLAHGGRNRRRACHMAGRGSAPRRQDGVPSAHREAEFSPRIAGGDASQGEVSPTRRWRGYQAAGASRGRRQPSGQRPRCPSARLPVPRVAGAIAAAHAIWREGGAPRAGRTEFPPRNRAAAQTRGRRANSRNWGLQKRAARGRIAPFEF